MAFSLVPTASVEPSWLNARAFTRYPRVKVDHPDSEDYRIGSFFTSV
jgi:hypothetical protein